MSHKIRNFNKKKEYYCSCYTQTKVNYLVSGCSDDASAVALLPYHWTPRRGGATLAKYLKEREENHFKALKDLQKGTSRINENIEVEIRVLAETLLCNINNNQCEVDCIIVKQELIEGTLPASSRSDALKKIENIISDRFRDISNFKEEALQLENKRANGLREVLHNHFGRLMAVRHESPKQLFQKFDEKIYEINQQLLSNCTAYNELEEQLRAQANESHKKARSLINQLCLGVGIPKRGRSALQCPDNNVDIMRRSQSAQLVNSPNTSQLSFTTAMELDACINRFIDEYQSEIGNIYAEFIDKLNDLHKRMGDRNFIQKQDCCAKEVTILERKVHQSFSRISGLTYQSTMTVNKEQNPMKSGFADCSLLMQKSLVSVGNQLKDIYTVLHEASHLWDAHMIRLATAQKLTMAAVEDLTTRHDSVELANDISFDITLEQLLTASDVDKLQLYYEGLCGLLKQKADEYVNHAELEISRLEDIAKLTVPLTNVVQAEFDLFIEKYLLITYRLTDVDEQGNVRESSRPRISIFKLQTTLPRDIYQTEMQEIALNNWRNGFLETFRDSLPLLSEKLENQIRSWIDERSIPLKRRHSFKMMSLDVRKERIITARDLRLAQLRQHEICLESHLGAVNELANSLPSEVSQLLTLDAPGLYPIREWIERIRLGMDEIKDPGVDVEVKRLKMMSYATRFANHRRIFEESLVSIVESTKKLMEQRLQFARISNVRYVSHLKLFSEGGNHSALEVTKICASLSKAGDLIENCMTRTLEAINHCRTELLSQVDQLINPLKAIAEDIIKETGKGIIDRKKTLPNKKK